jgi:NADPH:quinone reductase-like Zn-dependent oxidoreductase
MPVTYGERMAARIRAAAGNRVDAMVDTFGSGYVDLAINLGIKPERINTNVNYDAAARHGAKSDGNAQRASAAVLAELAQLIAEGRLEIPIAHTYPLAQVREACREVEQRHTNGKLVLRP